MVILRFSSAKWDEACPLIPAFILGHFPPNSRGRLMRGSTHGCFWWSSVCLFLSVWPGKRRAVKDGKLLIPGDNAGNEGGRPLVCSGLIKESIL